MKRVVILGSTGSIGVQTLDVIRQFPDRLEVLALAARRHPPLAAQAREFTPRLVGVGVEHHVDDYPAGTSILAGERALEQLASLPEADIVVVATVGRAGLFATLAALRAGKVVALANKEVLVMAGAIVTETARAHGGTIMPVDSEHNALWQCLVGEDASSVQNLVLTASGGALRNVSLDALANITASQALRHPTWKMGEKVTIDSATLMNKGLEVVEAHWLFACPYDKIRVVQHPTSVVHSLVQFKDGSIKAHLGATDMRLAIQYALSYPERWEQAPLQLDITTIAPLEFSEIEWERYPCLHLALEAGKRGGTYPAVLCGADEVAVDLFLRGAIPFTGIATLIREVLDQHRGFANPDLGQILEADSHARDEAMRVARRHEWVA